MWRHIKALHFDGKYRCFLFCSVWDLVIFSVKVLLAAFCPPRTCGAQPSLQAALRTATVPEVSMALLHTTLLLSQPFAQQF